MEPTIDRRKHTRHPLVSAVTMLQDDHHPSLFWIRNLSIGGALMCGAAPVEEKRRPRALLHLPWYQPITVDCRVVYQEREAGTRCRVGVEFLHTTPATELAISHAIRAAQECATQLRKPAVLVVSEHRHVSQSLQRQLTACEVDCVVAETPLDAIRWLQDWETVIESVIVDLGNEESNALSFLRFLSEEFPAVRRIVMADDEMPVLRNVAFRFGRCSAVLPSPWEPAGLERALQLEPPAAPA